MLFVFGYRARKIRSKKVSVLVHSSEHHAHLTHCSVSVHFHNIVDLVSAAQCHLPAVSVLSWQPSTL